MSTALSPTRGYPTAGEVGVGLKLPELAIPLTRTTIVSTAIATRDYQDVHHDHILAEQRGTPDIFMNILTSQGLVGRYVTDWAGPSAVVRKLAIRLGVPNYPGDTMTFTGEVTAKDGPVVTVTIAGTNSIGTHVTGTAQVELPAAPADAPDAGATGNLSEDAR